MDDKQFDKIFNEKLDELNVAYNEQAYQDFLARQANPGPVYGINQWIISGIVLSLAAISIYLYLHNTKLQSRVESLQNQYASTISLVNSVVTDTVRIVDTMIISNYRYLPLTTSRVSEWLQNTNNARLLNNYLQSHELATGEDNMYTDQLLANSEANTISSIEPNWWQSSWFPLGKVPAYRKTAQIVPRKKYNPLQINTGISAGVNIPYADQGATFLSNAWQFNLELFKHEQHRLFTGLSYANLNYLLEGTSDPDKYSDELLQNFPSLDEEDFLPRRITVSNRLWSIPVNYRFYDYLTNQWGLYFGGGVQLNMLSRQSFYYDYLDIKEGQLVEFDKKVVGEGTQISIGYLNATLGILYQIEDKINIHADINYLHNLSPFGIEQRRIHQLGFQAGLQYRLRR